MENITVVHFQNLVVGEPQNCSKLCSDICGRLEAKSLCGAEYFVTFIDDKSRYVWIYILKNKSKVFKKFLEWKSMVEKFSGEKNQDTAL